MGKKGIARNVQSKKKYNDVTIVLAITVRIRFTLANGHNTFKLKTFPTYMVAKKQIIKDK